MLDVQGLHTRAALFSFLRAFFSEQGFLEVDTPIRQPVILPECNIEPIIADGQYLQTSPELCMKRLLAAGCDKIFQICHCFRKNELGNRHLEEFTMLEWYRRGSDYHQLMEDCECLLKFIVEAFIDDSGNNLEKINKSPLLKQLTNTPEKITVSDAFKKYSPVPLNQALKENDFDELLVEYVEPQLGIQRPTFLIEYPKEMASLAILKQSDLTVAERFELYFNGIELANGFSELTESAEQEARFSEEISIIRTTHGRKQEMPIRFLAEIDSIGSAAGIAFGFDRLLMLLTGTNVINDVVSFSPEDF